jgi:hypothetical protein
MATRSGQRKSAPSTSESYDPARAANLYTVLWEAWGIHGDAATMMFAHGQVYIDGFCVPAPWASGHWTQGQLAGRMLKCVRGETRLYGRGRHAAQFEQMALA